MMRISMIPTRNPSLRKGRNHVFGLGRRKNMSKTDLRDHETELAIAAAVVVTAGVVCAILMSRRQKHPIQRRMNHTRKKVRKMREHGLDRAKILGGVATKRAKKGLERGADLLEDLPIDDIGDQLHEYLETAREAIEDTVSNRDLA